MRSLPNVGDHVFPRPGAQWNGKNLTPTYPLLVINVAAAYGEDAVIVTRDPAWMPIVCGDEEPDKRFGIMLAMSEIASIEAVA
jgi:hypothetical protein